MAQMVTHREFSPILLSAVFLDFRDHLWPEIFEIVVWAQLLKLFKLTINDFWNWLHEFWNEALDYRAYIGNMSYFFDFDFLKSTKPLVDIS